MVFKKGNTAAAKKGPTRSVKVTVKVTPATQKALNRRKARTGVDNSEYINSLIVADLKKG